MYFARYSVLPFFSSYQVFLTTLYLGNFLNAVYSPLVDLLTGIGLTYFFMGQGLWNERIKRDKKITEIKDKLKDKLTKK